MRDILGRIKRFKANLQKELDKEKAIQLLDFTWTLINGRRPDLWDDHIDWGPN